jgi:myosin-crossreactive antigen
MLKAVKRIEELIDMRRSTTDEDAINEYSIIEAGFLYQQGNMLVTYIESKSDVFGNIPALDVPESEDEDESESDEEGEGAEKQEEKDSGEPKIEDEAEVAKRKKLESLEEEKVP